MIRENGNHKRGFSIIELAVAASIISILAALAIPSYKRSRDNVRLGAFENDLRVYKQAFDTFRLENSFYPASASIPGTAPVGMETSLSTAWKLPTPIGGTYRWVYTTEEDPAQRIAYIGIVHSSEFPITVDVARLKDIDKNIDDGDPTTGQIRISGENIRYYLQEEP